MAALPYTKQVLITRIRRHVTNELFAGDEFPITDNEMLLYIDSAAATRIIGQVYANAKIDGALMMPEAYLITYAMDALVQNKTTGYWYAALPQPPFALPLGYSITDVYIAANGTRSMSAKPISAKRRTFRTNMPFPDGIFYWVENNTIFLWASNGVSLNGQNVFVQMPTARTQNMDDVMNLSEDDVQFIFDAVVKEIMQRYGVPQDIIKDNLPAGNKSS